MKKHTWDSFKKLSLVFYALGSLAACGTVEEENVQLPESFVEYGSSGEAGEVLGGIILPEDVEEELAITIALPSQNLHTEYSPWYERLVEEIERYTGVKVNWKWYDSKTYYQQMEQDILSGEVADVIVTEKSSTFLKAAEEGLFWELTPYLGEYDNLNEIPQANLLYAAHEGKLYGIPRKPLCSTSGVIYRGDWLTNLGLEKPSDWESFCEMLYAFTYGDPDGNGQNDTVGLCMDNSGIGWDAMEMWFGVPNEWGIDENGDLVHKTKTQEYRKAYSEFRRLYAQGVMNNGVNGVASIGEVAGSIESFDAAVSGCIVQNLTSGSTRQTALSAVNGSDKVVVDILPFVDAGAGRRALPSDTVQIMSRKMLAISTKNIKSEEALQKVLRFLNDVNDADCANLILYGWEGETYSLDVKYITGEMDEAGFLAALDEWWEIGGEKVTEEKNEKYHAAGF